MAATPQTGPPEGSRPVPDPTDLTTEALHHEIEGLRELLTAEVRRVADVFDERFDAVASQFALVETQRVEQKKDTKDAVDAALTAQKEAVREQTTASERAIAKSEASMKEQLSSISNTFTTAIEGQRDQIGDVKERVGSVEAQKVGTLEALRSQVAQKQLSLGAIGAMVAGSSLLVALIAVLANVLTNHP